MRAGQRYPLKALQRLRPREESVIQDVDIPLAAAGSFLALLHAEVGITPVWICPFRVMSDRHPLYRLRTDTPYVNFGFWDTVRSREQDGHYNAIVEQLVARHGGKKSLYSRSTFDEQAFWTNYDRRAYEALKRDYDPEGRFPGLYEKTVGLG
jgi:FAD/FMN-containing dehydrogenase